MNTVGYIYIFINKFYQGLVKIGYADDVEQRLYQANHPRSDSYSIPCFTCYAKFPVTQRCVDIKIHDLIDFLRPELRCVNNREFYIMQPDQAVELIEKLVAFDGAIGAAEIDTTKLVEYEEVESVMQSMRGKGTRLVFTNCGIKNGDILHLYGNEEITVTVYDENSDKVQLDSGEVMSVNKARCYYGSTHSPKWSFVFNGKRLGTLEEEYKLSTEQE